MLQMGHLGLDKNGNLSRCVLPFRLIPFEAQRFFLFCFVFRFTFIFMHMSILLVCMSVHIHAGATGSQKRALDPLKMELQTVVSCHVVAGNQILVL